MENSSYYFDNNMKKFRQCTNGCSTCDNEAYCTKCIENYHFIYNKIGKCISEPKKEDLLYLDDKTNTYRKCPEGTVKVENNVCIKNNYLVIIIIFILFFYIKRYISRKKFENEMSNLLEKNKD